MNRLIPWVVSAMASAALMCGPTIELTWENHTDFALDVMFSVGDHETFPHMIELEVGDYFPGQGSALTSFPPSSTRQTIASAQGDRSVLIIALQSDNRQVLFKRLYEYKELRELNWAVNVTDMR